MNVLKRFGNKRKNKISWLIFVIFLLFISAGLLDYPIIWNRTANWLNQKTGLNAPPFYNLPFRLGLDLQGGAHLVYEADFSNIAPENYDDSIEGARDVIERRVNLFGVGEPVVQVDKAGKDYRLIVELAGVADIHQAIQMIGQTPFLDFREKIEETETKNILADKEDIFKKLNEGLPISPDEEKILSEDPYFRPTVLSGRYLKEAQLAFDQQTNQPQINLQFDDEGGKIFEELTKNNIGKQLAIYLDGLPISAPVVQQAISGGRAQITGNFSINEAKELVRRLNAGALPVPIKLISQQTVGPSLGKVSLEKSLKAGLYGFTAILIFMIIIYRLPGLLASLALSVYIVLILAVFKLVPVTLSLSGLAGVILSIGMAVDANVLIFERLKEELKSGKSLGGSIDEGFSRAWSAIRDGNISTFITCFILFNLTSGAIKGFALTLGLGVLVSMFSAIVITKIFLKWFVGGRTEGWKWIWE